MSCRSLERSMERMVAALGRVLASDAQILAAFHTWVQAECVRAARTVEQEQEVLLARAARELVEHALLENRELRRGPSPAQIRALLEEMLQRSAPVGTAGVTGRGQEAADP